MRGVVSSTEGNHVDEAGNLTTCTYVDFRNPVERTPITTLYKASSRRHADPCGVVPVWWTGNFCVS